MQWGTLYLGVASCCFGLGIALSHHTFNDEAALSRSRKGFEEARLVPDLLSAFSPQGTMAIHFTDGKVLRHPGVTMLAQEIQACPVIQLYPGRTGQLSPAETFTLIILDPDSPIHANPSGAKLHLLATGLALERQHDPIETYNLVNKTRFSVDWVSPAPEPRTGAHRYTFLLYKASASQPSVQPFLDPTFNRSGFNLAQFTRTAGLQEPYAGAFFSVDSGLSENVLKQNAQSNSAPNRFPNMYPLSIVTLLPFLVAIYFC